MNILTRFSGKIYPDKTFSIGICPRKKKTVEDGIYDNRCKENWDSYTEVKSKYGRTVKTDIAFLSKEYVDDRFIKGSKSSRKVKKYGSKGITKRGKKAVSCFGAIMQQMYKRSDLGFGTATIPSYSDLVLLVIGCEWGEIVRRFFQKLRRCCQKKGREFIYYGVTEIQEKRYKRCGVPVPHLHWGFLSRDNKHSEFYFTANDARRFWQQSVTESLSRVGVIPERKDIDYRASIDLQIVKKSISAYMSKYLTKGCETVQEMVDNGFGKNLPSQWWFASMQMKKWLKEYTIRMSQDLCTSFFYGLEKRMYANEIEWCNFVEVETDPGRYVIFGLVGRLSGRSYEYYREKYGKNI